MKRLLIALLIAGCPACAMAAPLNDLYFGYDMIRSSEVYWWFLADGRVLSGLPTSGLNKSDFDNACASAPSRCGTYSLNGNFLVVQYRDGRSEKWQYKPLQGGFQMNYLILAPVQKAPAKLNGTWSRAFSSSFGGTTVTAPSWLTFRPDGSFSRQSVTGVDTAARPGAPYERFNSTAAKGGGTYSINGYDLTLTENGKTERHSVFLVAGKLNIDGSVYQQGK
jgi:hypothetical protein